MADVASLAVLLNISVLSRPKNDFPKDGLDPICSGGSKAFMGRPYQVPSKVDLIVFASNFVVGNIHPRFTVRAVRVFDHDESFVIVIEWWSHTLEVHED